MVNTILAKRINHIVAKGDNPVWPKGSKSRGFSRRTQTIGIELLPLKTRTMSYHFLERKDPRVDVLFQGLDNMERLIAAMEDTPKSVFHGERFLTDEELSKILRVSRRTLQEYRTLGVVPYYLVQGKALYKESDILKILEDSYKRCKEDMRWV